MANLKYAPAQLAESRGNNHHEHKLIPDTNVGFRYSDQRSTSQDTAQGSSHHTEGRGSEQSATEEAANEDDEDDSSGSQDDEQEEDDDPEVPAPSHGPGKGKGNGKRPAIRVEPSCHDESHADEDEIASHGTGPMSFKHPVNQLLMKNKKRTFSNLSSTSILFGDDSTDQESFPRRKSARRLSSLNSIPLLTYKEGENDIHETNHENAIESDDEDYSGVNLIPDDDDSDLELMEQQEESYILHEEQQATTLLNEYRDARRLSLDSSASENIFSVNTPLGHTFMSSLPDFGFGQFFEPEALPASPDPAVKRKYSDSSTKRVRFDDEVQVSDSSSSESSELDSNVFPDLFLDQDKLPPVLHHLLEMDDDGNGDITSPMSDGSFWDFGQDEPRNAPVDQSDDADDDSSDDSSGFDCTVVPYYIFALITNIRNQLTWVTPLMKKTLVPMCVHARPKTHLFCADHRQPQALEQLLPDHFNEVLGRWGIKLRLCVESLFMTIVQRPSQSQIEPRRLSRSIVHVHQSFLGSLSTITTAVQAARLITVQEPQLHI